ncbi:hypothetical protein Tco_1301429 [Tanacetum coccineum]
MQSWGRMDYARALVDIRVDRAIKDSMVISILNLIGNGVTMHTIKQGGTSNDSFQTVQKMAFCGPLVNKQGTGDNGKHMDDLVDDTRKKVEASHRKTDIWSGRKVNSPKRNIVFSPETKLNYFDKDDMEFDDMKQVVEEAEHGNAFSENG